MARRYRRFRIYGWIIVVAAGLWVFFPMVIPAAEENAGIQYEVCQSAKIEKVTYFLQKIKGGEELCFFITLKNVSAEPKRFRVKVFIPDGYSAGYLYPREGKGNEPPVIAPGASLTNDNPLPISFYSKLPDQFRITVEEI
jgi:hypothetical protein